MIDKAKQLATNFMQQRIYLHFQLFVIWQHKNRYNKKLDSANYLLFLNKREVEKIIIYWKVPVPKLGMLFSEGILS